MFLKRHKKDRLRGEVVIYNRETKRLEREKVFHEPLMIFLYYTLPGRLLTELILSRRIFSKLYALFQKGPKSREKIEKFIKEYQIDIRELNQPLDEYESFNDFFTRRLKKGARPIASSPDALISPADGRLISYDIEKGAIFDVKGSFMDVSRLLGRNHTPEMWADGLCVKIRLAPYDYHRFCYIDKGSHGPIKSIPGRLDSVSPLALWRKRSILQENKRDVVVLETENFGQVAHVDVGAMTVGAIHQHFRGGTTFSRGQEKGYFSLGGSTILLLFKKDVIQLDEDITRYSKRGIETLVRYGSKIGRALK